MNKLYCASVNAITGMTDILFLRRHFTILFNEQPYCISNGIVSKNINEEHHHTLFVPP